MVRGESLNRSSSMGKTHRLIMLCLSATMVLLWGHRQADALEVAQKGGAAGELKPQVEQRVSPPIEQPADIAPTDKPADIAPSNIPADIAPSDKPANISPSNKPSPASDSLSTRLVIKLGERRVYVYRDNQMQISYPIAVGKDGWETPVGTYQVMQMIKNPTWEHPWTGELVEPGPDNPLGTRWIGFWTDGKDVIGFHGTPNEDSVGQAASHGCVRMFDRDVQALFEKVSVGTTVVVEP